MGSKIKEILFWAMLFTLAFMMFRGMTPKYSGDNGKGVLLLQQTIEQCVPLIPNGVTGEHSRLMAAINLASLFRDHDLVGKTAEGDSLIFRDSTDVWKVYIKPSTIVFARQTTN